jgi:hypothetical protein
VSRWHALGRIAEPEEIADMALFLCSDESSFCSGQAYFVDGGLTVGINFNEKAVDNVAELDWRLGHATIAITLDAYSHAIPAMQEEAAALIAGLVFAGESTRQPPLG